MKRVKNTKELDQQYVERINRELYKRNVELTIRNKTFSLLRKLYDITISSVVSLKDLALRLATEIRQDLNFEMVGIYLLKEEGKELEALAVVKSERFTKALEKEKITIAFNAIKLKTNKKNACASAVKAKKNEIARSFAEIWPDKKFSPAFFDVQKKLPIKAVVVCPLLIEEKILGTLLIVLNREYDSLSTFEKETIENFVDVIAVALDKNMAYEELKVLDKAKSEFISMASHQLRTPLSAIKGYISMLAGGSYGKLPDKAREKLKNVFESNERLIRIVNDLLDISKIEMGKMELEKEPTQIEDLLQSCYEEMKIGADKKGLRFVFEKPKYSLPKIELDPLKFRQAILNLIDNAIRYTQTPEESKLPTGQEGKIEIEVKKTNSTILISVKDTGEGLTAEEQRAVFGGFTRGSAGIAHFVEGAGLGLYVAKKFLKLHHAKIWVESQGKGKGSTFFVELPVK